MKKYPQFDLTEFLNEYKENKNHLTFLEYVLKSNSELKRLAKEVITAQEAEIEMMQEWLSKRGK